MIEVIETKLNRRLNFRVFEPANLFFYKINSAQDLPNQFASQLISDLPLFQGSKGNDSQIKSWFPASESQENDTLNVNISTTGVAFTCIERLQAGDYLLAKILLLANMTNITTCCQVVYCKPSNPYENDRYPYLIGTRFVNLTVSDGELIGRYIDSRKTQLLILNSLLLMAVIIFLAMPDQILYLLLALGHYLFEAGLHLIYLIFEYVESSLDHAVEHLFHTGLHQTQVIVFYTLIAFGGVGFYLMWRLVPPACLRSIQFLRAYCLRKKASVLYYWGEQPLPNKIGVIALSIVSTAAYGYFVF